MADDVISLDVERNKREHELGHELHEQGLAFAFQAWDFDSEAIGFIEGDHPISILFDPNNLRGVAMTRDTAEKLIAALRDALDSPHAPTDEANSP